VKKYVSIIIVIVLFLNQTDCLASGEAAGGPESFPKEGIPVLMYHSIGSKYQCSICVSEKQFDEQMRWLYENGYSSLKLEEFYEALRGGPLPEKPVLITFDDGFSDNYRVAWPILRRYGFRATFFIVTGQVAPYNIDWDELRELTEAGNSIGSHTVDHRDLSTLNTRDQERELRQSKEALEKNLGIEVRAFCFPYGKYNKTTLSLLPAEGYTMGFTTESGKVRFGDDEYLLRRIHIWGGKPFSSFVEQVAYK